MSTNATVGTADVVDGPGRIAPGQRVHCMYGSLSARDGRQGSGVLVSIGPKTSMVDVYGSGRRRIRNELLHPQAGPIIAARQRRRGLPTTTPSGRSWLPGWSWLDWTVAQHVEFQRGERTVPSPPPSPQRLVIVACGARKAPSITANAGDLYTGSYHRAARRAADALATPGSRVMIVSALYGLLDLTDNVLNYDQRLGQPGAITVDFLREQAAQLGLTDTTEVIVLAPKQYAGLLTQVWPHAQTPLSGSRGIGDHMARFAAIADGRSLTAEPVGAARTATSVGEQEANAARADVARIEAELGASVRAATDGRVAEPTVALLYAALSHEQQLAEQRGQHALAQVLAARVAGLQEAYDADQQQRARQRADLHARIIAERAAAVDPREIVIIPGGARQLDRPAPAGEMYVGSYHQACVRAAATRGGRVLILSAKYGLLDPATVIEPYYLRMGQRGSITASQLRRQAGQMGVLAAPKVTVVAGRAYDALAREVWPNVEDPLGGTRGIAQERARLAGLQVTPLPVRGRQRIPAPAAPPGRYAQPTLFDHIDEPTTAPRVRGRRLATESPVRLRRLTRARQGPDPALLPPTLPHRDHRNRGQTGVSRCGSYKSRHPTNPHAGTDTTHPRRPRESPLKQPMTRQMLPQSYT